LEGLNGKYLGYTSYALSHQRRKHSAFRGLASQSDSAEKPAHFDLCLALRNAADTNIKLSIDKFSLAYGAKTSKMSCREPLSGAQGGGCHLEGEQI
jgi:hypothetical protein